MSISEPRSRMGELLLEMGLIDPKTLEAARAQERASGLRLSRILGEKKVVDEERLTRAVAAKLGLEVVAINSLKIHERVLSMVPMGLAAKYGVLPIAIKRANDVEILYLVMADPLDAEAIAEVQRVTGRQVRVLMASATEVDQAINEQYRSAGAIPGSELPRPVSGHASFASRVQSARAQVPNPIREKLMGESRESSAAQLHTDDSPMLPPPPLRTPIPKQARGSQDVSKSERFGAIPMLKGTPEPQVSGAPPKSSPPVAKIDESLPPVQPSDLEDPASMSATTIDPTFSFAEKAPPRSTDFAGDWDLAVSEGDLRNSELSGSHPSLEPEPEPEPPAAHQESGDVGVVQPAPFFIGPDDVEDMKTSQLELSEEQVQMLEQRAEAMSEHDEATYIEEDSDDEGEPLNSMLMAAALEVPVEVQEGTNPFGDERPPSIPIGLEKTGIIPALDLGSDAFEPPPLDVIKTVPSLAGSSDIPFSSEIAEARSASQSIDLVTDSEGTDSGEDPPVQHSQEELLGGLMQQAELQELSLETTPEEPVGAEPESEPEDDVPVIEPSSLLPLIEEEPIEAEEVVEDEPETEAPPEQVSETEPLPEVSSESETTSPEVDARDTRDLLKKPKPGNEADQASLLSALDGAFTSKQVDTSAQTPEQAEARELVASLLAGRSLTSADRAQLVLALGTLMIRKGLIGEEELVLSLTGADVD